MMDYGFTEEQRAIQDLARDIAEREIRPVAAEYDRSGECPWPIVRTLAGADLFRTFVPEEYDGIAGGTPTTNLVLVTEELSKACGGIALALAGTALGTMPILISGSEELKRRFLPDIAAGKRLAAFALTEPDAGSDAGGIRTTAIRDGDHYVLNGSKTFISNGQLCDLVIVVARTDPSAGYQGISLLVVDKQTKGVSARNLPGLLSWQAEVAFDGVEVAGSALLGGRENTGWAALTRAMERALPVLCAYQVGSCQAAFEMSVEYSNTRIQFGGPIGRFQRVQDHIVRLVNHLDAARWATYEALWKLDTGRPAADSVHLAKAVTAEAHMEACNAAHEVHAGIGSSHEYGLTPHTQLSRTLFNYLGDPKWHKRRMADVLQW